MSVSQPHDSGEFKLLGHDNIYRDYPAPVIPIGTFTDNDHLVAVYSGKKQTPAFEEIDSNATYVRHSAELQKQLEGFDPQRERLFAMSETDVRRYPIAQERSFIQQFLASADSAGCSLGVRKTLEKYLSRTDEHGLG